MDKIIKKCTRCLKEKPLSDFHILRGKYRQPKCKLCRKEYQDKVDIKARKIAYDKNRHEQTKDVRKIKNRKKCVASYGLTLAQYEKMLLKQGGCGICGRETNYTSGSFHIDHDHETGKVRGLLCFLCNVGLGNFRDNIEVMKNAVSYLRKHKKSM